MRWGWMEEDAGVDLYRMDVWPTQARVKTREHAAWLRNDSGVCVSQMR